jgi:hypothetical protein
MDLNKAKQNAQGLNQELGATEDSFRDMRSLLEGINEELGKKVNNVKEASKGYSDLTAVASKLALQEEEITRYSDDQLKKFSEKATAARKEIEERAKALIKEKGINKELKGNTEMLNQILKDKKDLTDEQQALLRGYATEFKLEDEIVTKVQEEVQTRKKVNDAMGITGGLLKAFNSVAGEFGKVFNLDQVQKDMEKFAEKTIRSGKEVSRLQTLGVGLKSAFSNLDKTLTDPAVIFTTLAKSALSVSQDVNNIQKATGMSYGNATALNAELRMTSQLQGQIQISTEKLHKAYAAVTTELGVAGDILGGEALISVSNLTDQLGMSTKEATRLALMSRLQGENTEEILSDTIATVGEFNKQNKTAINYKAVLSDVANSSKRLQVSLGANPKALTEAATAAASLGLSLKDVEQIADSLLNFETSIEKEMEAELLTGQQLNLEKAREFALNNDIKGLSEEISKNQGIINAFASGNRIQQTAIAEAMGLSVEQLGNMYYQQELNNLSAKEFKARYGETAYEQAKALSASEKFEASMNRVKEVIGNIGMALAPVLDLIAFIVSKWYVLYSLMGLVALSYVPKLVKGAKDFVGNIKSGFDSIKGIAKGIKDAVTGKSGMVQAKSGKFYDADSPQGKMIRSKGGTIPLDGDKTKKALEGAGDGAGKAAEKTKGVKGNLGKEIEQFLKGVGRGLKFIGQNFGDIFKGGLALLLASPGLIALGLAAPGLYVLSMIPGPAINAALTGLGRGLSNFIKKFSLGDALKFAVAGTLLAAPLMAIGLAYSAMGGDPMVLLGLGIGLAGLAASMFVVGKFSSQILQGSLALLVLGTALVPAAFAFSLLAGVDVGSIIAFSIALPLLALAAAGLGFLVFPIMAGAAALAVLGLALIPAGIAFSMIAGLNTEAIISFSTGVGILASQVALLGLASPLIIAGSFAMTALGLALIPLSMGFEKMASANVEGLVNSLQSLATVAPQLLGVAAGLGAISAGLASMAFTGLLALPVIGALTALGTVSGALSSIFGGEEGDKEDKGSMKAIEQKLDQLIAVISAGGDVYIDGAKVGKTVALATSRIG